MYLSRPKIQTGSEHTKSTFRHLNHNIQKSLFSISDVNKLYRREQTYKKKLKILIETNGLLQSRIKIYQSTIKDQRSTITFQLNELARTMNSKISTYVDEQLDKDRFYNNQIAHQTIKQMIDKFQEVEKQTKITKKVYQNLNEIYERYSAYSDQIDKLVKMTEKSNKQYQDSMKNMLEQKQNQIISKRQANEDIYDNTQNSTLKIDEFQEGKLKLIDDQKQLQQHYSKLLLVQQQKQKQVAKFHQWAQIVIDKNHRKVFNKQNKSKQLQLKRLTDSNSHLQIYLRQVECEEQRWKAQTMKKSNLKKTL